MKAASAVFICFSVLFAAMRADAAELVMFESEGCPWCAAWDRDIGEIFHKTDESKVLTLRRIDLSQPRPSDLRHIETIRFTPTFVVIDRGIEIGRIVGYTGQWRFWGLLGEIIAKLNREKRRKMGDGT